MPAPKGNQFWKLVPDPGRKKDYARPDLLWKKACEYFDWCDNNPIETLETEESLKESKEKRKYYPVPYTLEGVWLYLGLSKQGFENYGTKEGYEAFFDVIRQIKDIVRTQKFEGASVGLFNANIIARDLGLSEKQEVKQQTEVKLIKIGDQEFEI